MSYTLNIVDVGYTSPQNPTFFPNPVSSITLNFTNSQLQPSGTFTTLYEVTVMFKDLNSYGTYLIRVYNYSSFSQGIFCIAIAATANLSFSTTNLNLTFTTTAGSANCYVNLNRVISAG